MSDSCNICVEKNKIVTRNNARLAAKKLVARVLLLYFLLVVIALMDDRSSCGKKKKKKKKKIHSGPRRLSKSLLHLLYPKSAAPSPVTCMSNEDNNDKDHEKDNNHTPTRTTDIVTMMNSSHDQHNVLRLPRSYLHKRHSHKHTKNKS